MIEDAARGVRRGTEDIEETGFKEAYILTLYFD